MAIAKKPDSSLLLSGSNQITADQQAFISGAKEVDTAPRQKSKAVMLRIDPADLTRIDRAAKRMGLKRAAFILSSAIQRVEGIEQ